MPLVKVRSLHRAISHRQGRHPRPPPRGKMKAAFSQRFTRQYEALSPERKAKFDKQLGFL